MINRSLTEKIRSAALAMGMDLVGFGPVRRWKDAPSIHRTRLTGMRVTKLKAGATAQYPTGFRYERFELPSNRQIAWKNDGMYYVQFQTSDLLKMKNYVPNEAW